MRLLRTKKELEMISRFAYNVVMEKKVKVNLAERKRTFLNFCAKM